MAEEQIGQELEIGQKIELVVDRIAHGGASVGRYRGRVVFVRHAIPGEKVCATVTGRGPKGRFFFADTAAVLEPSPHRRAHPWAPADSLTQKNPVGGMEFGHIQPSFQRQLKADVICEQLIRLGGVSADNALLKLLRVDELAGGDTGWRTRNHFAVVPTDSGARIGMYPHSSSEAVPVADFPLLHPALAELNLAELDVTGVSRVDAAVSSRGDILLTFTVTASLAKTAEFITVQAQQLWGDLSARNITLHFQAEKKGGRRRGERPADIVRGAQKTAGVTETVEGEGFVLNWRVGAGGFWQIHPAAPEALLATVAELADMKPGETVYDLYCGAGLFTALAAMDVGESGGVLAVEGSPVTSANARDNFASGRARTEESASTAVEVVKADVGAHLARILPKVAQQQAPRPDCVLVDPSREGTGKKVVEQMSELAPARLVYVACDPAALGRDTGYLLERGWRLADLRAFDMYPNTHHVETVALFTRP